MIVTEIFNFGLDWQQNELYFNIAAGTVISLTGLFLLFMSLLVFVQLTNYLKGMTTNERFGRGARRHDSEYSEENQLLRQRVKTVTSNGIAHSSEDAASVVRRPTSKSRKLIKSQNSQDSQPFDPKAAMRKLQSKEFRNMDEVKLSNCLLMCSRGVGVRD